MDIKTAGHAADAAFAAPCNPGLADVVLNMHVAAMCAQAPPLPPGHIEDFLVAQGWVLRWTSPTGQAMWCCQDELLEPIMVPFSDRYDGDAAVLIDVVYRLSKNTHRPAGNILDDIINHPVSE